MSPPPVFKIMGTAHSNYRYVDAKAEHGNRMVRVVDRSPPTGLLAEG